MPGIHAILREHAECANRHQLRRLLDDNQCRDQPMQELRRLIVGLTAATAVPSREAFKFHSGHHASTFIAISSIAENNPEL